MGNVVHIDEMFDRPPPMPDERPAPGVFRTTLDVLLAVQGVILVVVGYFLGYLVAPFVLGVLTGYDDREAKGRPPLEYEDDDEDIF